MSKKPQSSQKDVMPMAVTTVGLLACQTGYEVYDPNNSATPPIDVIGWLIQENNGVNQTKPITTTGDAPAGWKIRYRGVVEAATVETTDGHEDS